MSKKELKNLPPRIAVQFNTHDYELIKNISEKEKESLGGVVRKLVKQSLDLKVYQENCDMLCQLLTQVVKNTQQPEFDRLSALLSKSTIMSATSAYLNAEAISSFVGVEYQQDTKIAYEKARLKAVKYTKSQNRVTDLEDLW